MNLIIVSGNLVFSSFLISVYMFIVTKALLISSVTVVVRTGESFWLNPLAKAITVEQGFPTF